MIDSHEVQVKFDYVWSVYNVTILVLTFLIHICREVKNISKTSNWFLSQHKSCYCQFLLETRGGGQNQKNIFMQFFMLIVN